MELPGRAAGSAPRAAQPRSTSKNRLWFMLRRLRGHWGQEIRSFSRLRFVALIDPKLRLF